MREVKVSEMARNVSVGISLMSELEAKMLPFENIEQYEYWKLNADTPLTGCFLGFSFVLQNTVDIITRLLTILCTTVCHSENKSTMFQPLIWHITFRSFPLYLSAS